FQIAAWSIVNGMNTYMAEKFAGTLVGVNTFHVRRTPNFTPNVSDSVWRAWRRRPRITFEDARAVEHGITIPVQTAWWSQDRGTVAYGLKTTRQVGLNGASAAYFAIRNIKIEMGRAFTPQEDRAGSNVAVLGHDLAERLFEGRDPIGKTLRVNGLRYRVIVGGIVIMNIMLMAVAERTREIGLRKSLGARRRDILWQFLSESATIAAVGAALGVCSGILLSALLDAVTPLPARVSPGAVVL